MSFWEMFPLAMQVVYAVSALVPLRRIWLSKHSDQHPVVNQVMTLGAHGAMVAWAHAYAGELGLLLSYAVGVGLTVATLGFVLYYRFFPGGRSQPLLPVGLARRALARVRARGRVQDASA